MNDHATFSLTDDAGSEQVVKCRCDGSALHVHVDGHGFHDDLVRLEHRDGRLALLVWGDVNDDQPTHVIDLEPARQQHQNDEIAEAKERLRNEKLSPVAEGELFLRVYQSANWRTGKQFTMREAARELAVEYARFRNHLMLVMPCDGSPITDEQRMRMLDAPISVPSSSSLRRDLQRRRSQQDSE